jgi:phage terminase large subunit-like protein
MAIPDIVDWAQSGAGFYLAETRKPIVLANHQADILRHVLTPGDDGRLPYDTVVYSAPKKSGKTTIAAVVAEYFGLFIEPPNELFMVSNSLEQSQGRSYKALSRSVSMNPSINGRVDTQTKYVKFDNGTDCIALSSDYAGAAGSNHGLTVWDELWAYLSENAWRLWDELTPIPTKTISLRFVATYAGFSKESKLLEELYDRGMAGEVVPELAHIDNGEGEPACRRSGRTFVYWDHELKPHPGLHISPDEYHADQRRSLRRLAYIRLHENRFTSNESSFITPEQWEACYSPEVRPLAPGDDRLVVLGADASTSRDSTALVGVTYDYKLKLTDVVYCRIWKPQRGILPGKATIDLDATLKADIVRLRQSYYVAACFYDPYQLHSVAMNLRNEGVNMIEMPQTARRTEADQALYDAILGRLIRHYGDPALTEHMTNAVAKESERGYRLAKEKTSLKIDAAVALSMANKDARRFCIRLKVY